MDLPSRLDLLAIGQNYIKQNAKKIDPDQVYVAGSDANLFVGSMTVVAKRIVDQLAFESAKQTIDGSDDTDLDRWMNDHYYQQVPRKGASSAQVPVRIFRAAATVGSGTVPKNTKLRAYGGAVYTTNADVAFSASALTVTVYATAAEAGKATQVSVGQINSFVAPASLFDTSLQVTNDVAAAGGEDAEDDDTYRDRGRSFWIAASRGTLAAIEFGAKTVLGVVSASAIEASDIVVINGVPVSLPARVVMLYIADSTGMSNAATAALVDAALNEYRAGGIAVIISVGMPQLVDITLRLAFAPNVDTVTLTDTVSTAIVIYVNSLGVNKALGIGDLNAVLARYKEDGLLTEFSEVVAPTGSIIPMAGQTLRTTTARITVVV